VYKRQRPTLSMAPTQGLRGVRRSSENIMQMAVRTWR
jgi:hypothetical protein